MSIEAAQKEFIDSFNELNDWFMQYELLLEIAGMIPIPEDSEKNEMNRIQGCQTNTWLVLRAVDGKLLLFVDSESQIIRGILGVFVMLLQNQRLEDAADAELCFIEKTALKEQLSTDRFNAMSRVREMIVKFCRQQINSDKGENGDV
ncbi:SufE family protein [Schaedlerella arabinosiphila]|jgi:sulfur transfer protein SufE|uniref:SufE family protein n=1 Tax=Schaedlerella arabinosiphila TaxID=2044587 RepID=A0A3R8JK18_9FIRM|nr:SufE family protein [Schaedlerella arabinosiphila]RRK30386.1 SufE family protein [Schaedlerella arabinosiphila]